MRHLLLEGLDSARPLHEFDVDTGRSLGTVTPQDAGLSEALADRLRAWADSGGQRTRDPAWVDEGFLLRDTIQRELDDGSMIEFL
jgi:hypothetical protein